MIPWNQSWLRQHDTLSNTLRHTHTQTSTRTYTDTQPSDGLTVEWTRLLPTCFSWRQVVAFSRPTVVLLLNVTVVDNYFYSQTVKSMTLKPAGVQPDHGHRCFIYFPGSTPPLVLLSSLTSQLSDGSQLLSQRAVAVVASQTELLHRDAFRRTGAEVPQEVGHEEEELHPGQALRPASHPHKQANKQTNISLQRKVTSLSFGWRRKAECDPPAENGRKASRLTNFPSLPRKWAGLNLCGSSHSFSSNRTEASRGSTADVCFC